jgi:hypothetical protein
MARRLRHFPLRLCHVLLARRVHERRSEVPLPISA